MWSATRLPAEHGPLRAMPTPSPQHAGSKPTGTMGRKGDELPPCFGICRRCDGIHYPSSGIRNIPNAIQCFERAIGAQLNPSKSKAMALGGWTASATDLGIAFHDSINVLGVTFGPTITHAMKYSWTGVINAVIAQARTAYTRSLCFAQQVRYVQVRLLAKIWYTAQIVPSPLYIHSKLQQYALGIYGRGYPPCTSDDATTTEGGRRLELPKYTS